MNFSLSAQQKEFQATLARLLDDHCASAQLHKAFDAEAHDTDLWNKICELGVAGVAIPEDVGGIGLGMVDLALIAETLGSRAAPVPWLGHTLAGLALNAGGSHAQRARWLPLIASAECLAGIAFAEQSGWEPKNWKLACDQGKLTGTKRHVMWNEDIALWVVGLADGEWALVERDAPGLRFEREEGVDRSRPLATAHFVDTPCEPLPSDIDLATFIQRAACVLLAADAFGGASRCVEMAVAYSKVREQFGQPIGQFQAVKHQLANMAVEVEPARGLYWYAAYAFDRVPNDSYRYALLAKAHLADRFLQVARDTVEVHGGMGYTWECDVHIFLKRAMFDFAWMGNPASLRACLSL